MLLWYTMKGITDNKIICVSRNSSARILMKIEFNFAREYIPFVNFSPWILIPDAMRINSPNQRGVYKGGKSIVVTNLLAFDIRYGLYYN